MEPKGGRDQLGLGGKTGPEGGHPEGKEGVLEQVPWRGRGQGSLDRDGLLAAEDRQDWAGASTGGWDSSRGAH